MIDSTTASWILKRTTPDLSKERVDARTHYFRIGLPVWKETYARMATPTPDPALLLRMLMDHYRGLGAFDPEGSTRLLLILHMEEGQMSTFQGASWIQWGMPVVQLAGHRYAAALAATGVPSGVDIRPPWPTFLLELPGGMFWTMMEGTRHELTHAMVTRVDGRYCPDGQDLWTFVAYSPSGATLFRTRLPLSDMLEEKIPNTDMGAFSVVPDDQDTRTLFLISRIILNTCLVMADPDEIKPVGKHRGTPGRPSQAVVGGEPEYRTYRIGKPIVLDVRPALNDYLEGRRKGSSPTVRFVVRGHWRQQACGQGRADRRPTWIHPHWKGPEEAAINVRPHVVAGEE